MKPLSGFRDGRVDVGSTEAKITVQLRYDANRTISGNLLIWGDVYRHPNFSETFLEGSITDDNLRSESILLKEDHSPQNYLAKNGDNLHLKRTDKGIDLVAILPDNNPLADRVLERINRKDLTGLSVEFTRDEFSVNKHDITIQKATLLGVGVVRSPAYKASRLHRSRKRYFGLV